jgi:hypothetical protein
MFASLEFALSRGLLQIHAMRGMSLQAPAFSFNKWKGLGETLSAKGFVVTTLRDVLQDDPDADDKLAKLYELAREGWPTPDRAGIYVTLWRA